MGTTSTANMQALQGQDWQTVGWAKDNSANRTSPANRQATQKQIPGKTHKQKQMTALDQATEAVATAKCSLALSTALRQARTAKKWSQKQLGVQANLQAS